MTTAPTITHATPTDCAELAAFAARSFADTFAYLYSATDLAVHLSETYHPAHFADALAAGETILIARANGRLIAYASCGAMTLPVADIPEGAQEIHRLYIDRDHHGQGLGRALMDRLMQLPRLALAPALYLGAWEQNSRALNLYKSYGFRPIGTYIYRVGGQADIDLILKRDRSS